MRRKYQRQICFMLVICMLFSGVCLEMNKADSLKIHATKSPTASQIICVQEKIMNNDSCTIEMLGFRNVSGVIRATEQLLENWVLRNTLFFVCINHLFHSLHSFFSGTNIPQFPKLYPKAVVLNYIHNKDGKK